ncbi:MAG: hypothetical protein SFW67_18010 [Myxococcaceae bacterium]|nr:hypothetical protein [Myxococcaceae bacterium]
MLGVAGVVAVVVTGVVLKGQKADDTPGVKPPEVTTPTVKPRRPPAPLPLEVPVSSHRLVAPAWASPSTPTRE